MRKIRSGVFETNSSAVHCLVVPKDLLAKSEFKIDRHGMIKVGFITEDVEYPLVTQYDKLSYLITQIYYESGCYYNNEPMDDDYRFEMIDEYISDYTGANGIEIDNSKEPDINHQAVWDDDGHEFIEIYDKDAVLSFVFGPMMVREYMD